MFWFKKKRKIEDNQIITTLVLSVVLGMLAGAVGVLVMVAYYPAFWVNENVSYANNEPSVTPIQVVGNRTALNFSARDLAVSKALFYKTEDIGEITLPVKAIGQGVVLTSDGWFLTHSAVLTSVKRIGRESLSVVIDGKVGVITDVVTDPYSGVAFVKAELTNLPVVPFAKKSNMVIGEEIFSFDTIGGLLSGRFVGVNNKPAEDINSAVRSAEQLQKVMMISDADSFVSGAPVFDSSGQVVAVYVEKTALGSYAVPVDDFFDQVGSVLKDKETVRHYLGIRYIDLSEFPAGDGRDRGVKIRASVTAPAIIQHSPAYVAGLRVADIITAVNKEPLTNGKSFSGLLSEYGPNETINLSVIRNNREITVSVTLKQLP